MYMSEKIITLPKQLANQIAAGEVVERPVSVVKELVENSLDAWASHIKIVLENAGISTIEVYDNGEGMSKKDMKKSLEKYSTSKIKNLEDLYHVMTFGFRGEALASISSVSHFSIISKTSDSIESNFLNSVGWDEVVEWIISRETGTTICVKNLFFNTPARLNYLKTPRTELLKVQEYIQKTALWHPEISLQLIHDDKELFYFGKNQNVESRIYSIFWQEFGENLCPVSYEFGGIRLHGYMSDPKISLPNKNRQVLFINKRIITSPMISKAIFDAYNRYIPHGTHPAYVLHIELDPTQVDVNVHPRKQEVRFAEESIIFRSVYHGLKNILEKVTLVSEIPVQTTHNENAYQREEKNYETPISYYTGSGTKFKNYSPYTQTRSNPSQHAIDFSKHILGKSEWSEDWNTYKTSSFSWDLHHTRLWKILGQAHNSYIIVETPTGIKMLDQHALAERVIFERLRSSSYIAQTQWILGGIWIHLTSDELEKFQKYETIFEEMWFEIELLSHNTLMIHGIPNFVSKMNIEKIFLKIVSDIEDTWSQEFEEVRNKIFAYTACRSAVKFWDPLSIFEMHALLQDASLEYSATCPHGRPVVYDIGLDELKKKYER